jgi:large subunit ribosomal protein L24
VALVSTTKKSGRETKQRLSTKLKVGDVVMVISGGNSKSGKMIAGHKGKILRILPKRSRAVVEGVNMIKRHKRAMTSGDSSGVIVKEGSIHLSNLMFYSADLQRPVRIKMQTLADGRKVRGYVHPETKKFEQIDV